jgi:tetratricopeptide (TPR) repeat protein
MVAAGRPHAVAMPALLKSAVLSGCLALAACATVHEPSLPPPESLFADALFGAPSEKIDAGDIFALTEEMKSYARSGIGSLTRGQGMQAALVEALYRKRHLRLEYESAFTRTAAQAFEARAGNCLSLVIMTAAFAKELGLKVRYQSAYLEESWSRKGNLLLKSGHVNVTLGGRLVDRGAGRYPYGLTIDFLPPEELRGLKTREIPESIVVGMFMNNRAVEALIGGHLDDAYAWAREAVREAPDFLAAQNTLGVIYLRRGALPEAAAVFSHLLERDPDHTRALANLAEAASRQGRTEEAARLRERLARLEQEPPLHFFNLGLAAMKRDDYRAARDLFAREAGRGDAGAEVHYWLGLAHLRLGDHEQATREFALAAESSASRSERDLYTAKLEWLRAHQMR